MGGRNRVTAPGASFRGSGGPPIAVHSNEPRVRSSVVWCQEPGTGNQEPRTRNSRQGRVAGRMGGRKWVLSVSSASGASRDFASTCSDCPGYACARPSWGTETKG
jgi:hypothetical protein